MPDNIYKDTADVFITLKDHDFRYLFEVTTPQAFASHTNERKKKFLEPITDL